MIPISRLILSNTPVGPLTLVASRTGLREIRFGIPTGPEPEISTAGEDHPVLAPARLALEAYFRARREEFVRVPVELATLTPFQQAVLQALREVPFGELTTYGALTEAVGQGSPRSVGQAVGANPLPILIPCHRVVAADRRLGGYSGGLDRKVTLLELEGHRVGGPAFDSRLGGREELMLPL